MFDGLLFDLDGTLWDSVDSICLSWNRVLERIAPQYAGQITRPRLIGCMGMLLPDIVKKLLPDLDWKDIQAPAGRSAEGGERPCGPPRRHPLSPGA